MDGGRTCGANLHGSGGPGARGPGGVSRGGGVGASNFPAGEVEREGEANVDWVGRWLMKERDSGGVLKFAALE